MSRLDDREGFAELARSDDAQKVRRTLPREMDIQVGRLTGRAPEKRLLLGEVLCSTCGELRRVQVEALYLPPGFGWKAPPETLPVDPYTPAQDRPPHTPALLLVWCPQCQTKFTLVVHDSASGWDVLLLADRPGRAGTPHTPPEVAYYVDQAERAKRAGAMSAALAMYRAALEALLHQQGFEQRHMSEKISAVREEKGSGSARPWVAEVDDVALEMLKKLADGTLHLDGGDVARQAAIDADLLRSVELVVSALMHSVYETGAAHAEARSRMQQALRHLRGRAPEGEREPAEAPDH
jgi:hypothetical protein